MSDQRAVADVTACGYCQDEGRDECRSGCREHNLRAGDCEDLRARLVFPSLSASCPVCRAAS